MQFTAGPCWQILQILDDCPKVLVPLFWWGMDGPCRWRRACSSRCQVGPWSRATLDDSDHAQRTLLLTPIFYLGVSGVQDDWVIGGRLR
jgi:hypothetical protein